MKVVGLFDAKNRLSEVCDHVARTGEPCMVTRRGKALVRIVPVRESGGEESVWSTLEVSRERYGPLADDFDLPERFILKNRSIPF